jgi:rfaE bifunctional protein nucleotidyltransferase chain/domain
MTQRWQEAYLRKVIAPEDIERKAASLREEKKTIATINGSFDLLHAGHLEILYFASQQADTLIVALNSDASIQKYKSPTRPIISLSYRMQMMAALEFVDFVTFFEETDPIALLEKIRPHVHINGSDWGENCIEADTVKKWGRLSIFPHIPGLSTSSILKKAQEVTN